MSRRVLIIGGGFSGLSAGVRLAEAGFEVLLLERRQQLGGRAYSFIDSTTGDVVDNGQHLFMGCYRHTISFLERIGCLDKLKFQPTARVDFLDLEHRCSTFECPALPAPLHALVALFRMKGISLPDKLRTLNVGLAIRKARNGAGDRLTVSKWLDRLKQSAQIKERFWYPMMIATLNESPEIASARMMKVVLREAFGSGPAGTRIGIARVGLSELYTVGARSFIEARGGEIRTGAEVKSIVEDGKSVSGVIMKEGETIEADYLISSVPPAPLSQMLPSGLREGDLAGVASLGSSPIVSINLWYDRPVLDREFVGLLGTRSQWAFNKDLIFGSTRRSNHIAVVISAAHDHVDRTKQELIEIAVSDLERLIPETRSARLLHSTIVKEREATLSHTLEADLLRPPARTSIPNFFLAGDWIDTGLPATIESAVLSGADAAELIVKAADRQAP